MLSSVLKPWKKSSEGAFRLTYANGLQNKTRNILIPYYLCPICSFGIPTIFEPYDVSSQEVCYSLKQ